MGLNPNRAMFYLIVFVNGEKYYSKRRDIEELEATVSLLKKIDCDLQMETEDGNILIIKQFNNCHFLIEKL